MKHEDFTRIGQTALTAKPANLSGAGNNAGQGGAVVSPQDTARVRAYLGSHKPQDVDKAAVLRASQLGVGLAVKFDYRFPKDERGNSLPLVTLVKGVTVSGSAQARADTVAAIRRLEINAEPREVEGWLAELSVITARRADDEFSETLRLEAYASRLRRYPADVAREAVLGRSWKFWPAWSELETVCDQLAAPRRAMIRALEAEAVAGSGPERERVSAERAREIMREVWGSERASGQEGDAQ